MVENENAVYVKILVDTLEEKERDSGNTYRAYQGAGAAFKSRAFFYGSF